MCAGASIAAAPLIALSLLAPEHQQSFAALLIGFALSETWRAPAAVLIREVSPPELGATGSALHLCIRNLVGGCGPLSMALVTSEYLLAILMYILSVLQLSCLKSIKHSSIRAECPAQEQMIRAKANLSSDSVLVVQTDSSEFQVTGIVNTRLSL